MYNTIKQSGAHYHNPDRRHFVPSCQQSCSDILHFNYKLSDLQQEIEKRTFYLGKFRKTEQAQHLLDLIGMSRDEGDLLFPFMKAAMADVYDTLNTSSLHITKRYEWKDMTSAVAYGPTAQVITSSITTPSLIITSNYQTDVLHVSGSFNTSLGINNSTLFDKGVECEATFTLKTQVASPNGETVDRIRTGVSIKIPFKKIICSSYTPTSETWQIIPFDINWKELVHVDPAVIETIHPTEPISSCVYTSGTFVMKSKLPVVYHVGDVIDNTGSYYRVLVDCDSNTLNTSDITLAEPIGSEDLFSDGINYYLEIPGYIDNSSAEPLDNAILEALVNRVIWKWLILSYPEEAATYDELFKQALVAIAVRCNIFQRNWQVANRPF